MDTEEKPEKAPGSRVVVLLALLALVVDAAAAFGRVYQGSRPAVRLAVAAGVAVLLAAALERRHILIATVASAAGLVVAAGLLIFPHTLYHGLPTATTLRAAQRAWSLIGDTARNEVAPARPLGPLFLAGLTAVWAAAFSSHSLATRARSPFLALLPPAALLAFPSILLDEGARPFYVVTFLIGTLALLFADALRRVGQWGPVAVWQGRRRRFGTAGSARGARRLGLLCLGVALLIPGILPGYRHGGLVDVHSTGHRLRVAIDPIVDIRPQLLRKDAVDLFVVTSTQPTYWRFAALDTYNGRIWNASNLEALGGREVESGSLESMQRADPIVRNSRVISQHYQITGLGQRLLPAAYDPIAMASPDPVRYDAIATILVREGDTEPGFTYDVTSRLVTPSFEELDAVRSLDGSPARYLRLPPIPSVIADVAYRIADPEPTPYRKILAIQDYLRSFQYNDHVAPGHNVDQLVHFLTQSKAGYCEQFAGAMAVMLRSIGIPARVAVGFTPGEAGPLAGSYKVTTKDAHAWVEVLFPTFGWLPFEPTPTRRNPATLSIDFPLALSPSAGAVQGPSETCLRAPIGRITGDPCERGKGGKAGSTPTASPGPSTDRRGERGGRRAPASPTSQPVGWRIRVLEGALLLALLLLVAIPSAKLLGRRVTVGRARAPRDRIAAAYDVMAAQAADLGLGRLPAETLWEYRARLRERVRALDREFDFLTGLAGRAVYSERAIGSDQADRAAATARAAIRSIRRASPTRRRIASWFWVDWASIRRRLAI